MKTKDVDAMINKHFKGGNQSGWYGFKVNCDIHQYGLDGFGLSNLSPVSQQEYCRRLDRRGRVRPTNDPLRCDWRVCPKLKEMFRMSRGKGRLR